MSAVNEEEISEGVPEKDNSEDLQMKQASEEAVACSMLSGSLLHPEERGTHPINRKALQL